MHYLADEHGRASSQSAIRFLMLVLQEDQELFLKCVIKKLKYLKIKEYLW